MMKDLYKLFTVLSNNKRDKIYLLIRRKSLSKKIRINENYNLISRYYLLSS